ncbi:MAG: restriction endonuclease subunit S [Bacteroidales bacterium]|jgi:type I restriction enzyme S subunit
MKKLKLIDVAPYSGKRVQPFDGVKRYLSTGDLQDEGLSFEEVTFNSKPSRADILVSEGDILFAKMLNTNKVLQIDKSLDGIIVSTGFSVHNPDENVLYGNYLIQFLKNNSFLKQKNKFCTGAIQSAITNIGIEKILIPVPSLSYQIYIATILSKAELIIDQRKKSIDFLDEFLKSTFGEIFGDPQINKKQWNIDFLGKVIETLTDYHANGSYEILRDNVVLKKEPDYALMVRTTDLEKNDFSTDCNFIDEKTYNFLEKSKVFGGEIIINKIGSAGKVYLMPHLNRPTSLGMNSFLLRFTKDVNNIYIYYLLTSDFGKNSIAKHVKGAVTKTITKEAVRSIKIPIPPLELQIQFANIVTKTDVVKGQYKKSLKELEKLYDSLCQQAFKV